VLRTGSKGRGAKHPFFDYAVGWVERALPRNPPSGWGNNQIAMT